MGYRDRKDVSRPKVAAAFEALRKVGITCRMNFSCCGGCGSGELATLMEKQKTRGGVFYHVQDEECWQDHGVLHLRFGSAEHDSEAKIVGIGKELVAALQVQGLTPEWDGTAGKCVVLQEAA